MVRAVVAAVIFLLLGGTAFSEEFIEGFALYEIKSKDSLQKIAPEEHWDIIKKVNRIDERHMRPGRKILIPVDLEKAQRFCPVPKSVPELASEEKALICFLDIQYFGAYEKGELVFWGPISSGAKGRETPEGIFSATWKSQKYWSKKYDAPMPFAVNLSNTGFFLHAQAMPGKPASHGCIRLLMEDAKKLFAWVSIGDKVIITEAKKLQNAQATNRWLFSF